MSKPEIEELIRASCEAVPDEGFDRRLLAAANDLLAARAAAAPAWRERRSGARLVLVGALLAAAVILFGLLFQVLRSDDADRPARELMLTRGALALDARSSPVVLTTPLGRVLLAEGRARVEVVDARSSAEEREAMRTKHAIGGAALAAAVWLGVEVFRGRAEVETDAGRVALAAGEQRAFVGAGTDELRASATSDADARVSRDGSPALAGAAVASGPSDRKDGARRGSVRDERGAPIADACIAPLTAAQAAALASFRSASEECRWTSAPTELALALPRRAPLPAEGVTQSAADGSFVVPAFAEDGAALSVEAPGFAPLVVFAVDRTRREPLELVLRERVELELAIFDEREVPLAGVSHGDLFACAEMSRNLVRLCLPLEGGLEAAIPIPERGGGRFALPTSGVATGARLEIAWIGAETTRVPIAFEASTPMPLRFTVKSTPHIAGRVLRESGEPFAAASVFLDQRLRNGRRNLAQTLSDELGWFRLPSASTVRTTRVRAQAEGFAAADRRDLEVPTPTLELVLKPLVGALIAGRVEDEAGRPLAGQEFRLVGEDFAFNGFLRAKSGDDGGFRFEALQAGRYEVCWERERPFIPIRSAELELAAGEQRIDLVLSAPIGGRIVVKALDVSGAPLRKGEIELRRPRLLEEPEYLRSIWLARESDPAAHVFAGLPAGRYALVLDNGRQIESVRLKEGETVEVTLGGAGALELRGRILRAGAPIVRAEVAGAPASGDILSARETRSDDEGRFALIGLAAGRVLFRVHEREPALTWFAAADFHGAPDEELALSAPDGVLEVALAAGLAVPQRGARVRVSIERLDGVDLRRSVPATYRVVGELVLDRDGRGSLSGLASGTYFVELEIEGRTLEARLELAGGRARAELK